MGINKPLSAKKFRTEIKVMQGIKTWSKPDKTKIKQIFERNSKFWLKIGLKANLFKKMCAQTLKSSLQRKLHNDAE